MLWGATLGCQPGSPNVEGLRPSPGPAPPPAAAPHPGVTLTQLEAHLATMELPPGTSVIKLPPFLVMGDEAPATVQAHVDLTVRWAMTVLRADFFPNDLAEVHEIWLLGTPAAYEATTLRLFGQPPTTPYGFYHGHRLVMNINTGGGTLLHELVHPYIAANIADCPPWYNEGLGSLFEAAAEVDGHARGRPNWRLPELQRSLRSDTAPGFVQLTTLDAEGFYGEGSGLHYARARYLLYWLQETDRLLPLHQQMRQRGADDPTGIGALRAVLGPDPDLSFGAWRQFILDLSVG